MKILIAHNAYQHRGGEDMVAGAETELLRRHGHQVELYERHNRDLASMSMPAAAMSCVWSHQSNAEIARVCDTFQPDVIHAHNTFPLISPSLYWLASRKRIPVVQTLHNFRLLCPQAMFLREEKVCEDCLGKLPWRAVTRKCYRGSALQSAVAVTMLAGHRAIGTYREQVTAYIAVSNFCREKFISGGLPAERIHIKPNFVESRKIPDWNRRRGGIFIGRLSAEKGLDLLMAALRRLQLVSNHSGDLPSLRIVGAGPLEPAVRAAFTENYLGYRPPDEVFDLLGSSQFLVAPSTCYETFGLVAVEAFACGVPVIASRHGGIGELVDDGVTGLLFTHGDANDLAAKIAWAHTHPQQMLEMGRAAYSEYLAKYTPEQNYRMLMGIYQKAIPVPLGEYHAA